MDFFAARGFGTSYSRAIMDPRAPWQRCTGMYKQDPRLNPPRSSEDLSGSRIFRHPYLDAIIYPRLPDETVNFDTAPLRRCRTAVTKTKDSSAIARYLDAEEDVVIHEIWAAKTASTTIELFRAFMEYFMNPLPFGEFCGWQPRDLSPRGYLVHLIDVRLGSDENYPTSEIGDRRPYLLKEAFTVSFKLVAEAQAPASVAVMGGL